MKIKNIIILGGIVFAIYYLSKKKTSTITATVTPEVEGGDSVPDNGDINLENVMNGDMPQSEAEADVLRLFKQANDYYTGGARPSTRLLAGLRIKREQAKLRLKKLGLLKEFNDWLKTQKKKDGGFQVPMGNRRYDTPRPVVGDVIQIRRDKMPLPRNRRIDIADKSLGAYQNRLGLTNMPPMAI